MVVHIVQHGESSCHDVDLERVDCQQLKADTIWSLFAQRAVLGSEQFMLMDVRTRQRLRYAQALDIAERLAAGLLAQGIEPGCRVDWRLPVGLPAVMTTLVLARLGVIQQPLLPSHASSPAAIQ